MYRHYVKKDDKNIHKCVEPCPIMNDDIRPGLLPYIGIMIGSVYCQNCKHHKNNDYDITLTWIECGKLIKKD